MRCLLIALLGWPLSAVAEPAEVVPVDPPRSYGYVIGDVIELQWRLTPPPGLTLKTEALPKPGSINRWLVLKELRATEQGSADRRSYRLQAVYQTFRAPLAVVNLTIPGLPLTLEGPAGSQVAATPDWTFKMAPLRELSVFDSGGADPIRPDALPPKPDRRSARWRVALSLLAAAAGAAWLGYREVWLPYRGRGRHFRQAEVELRRLPAQGSDDLRPAYASLHRAFNRTLGEPLFADGLGSFLAGRPEYEPLRGELEAFFAVSYDSFFGSRASAFSLDRLVSLCRACRRIEQERT
ncbi:MAG: nonribosomal peptide synthetase MxaA [Methylococcaceae bacterium]|nr:nonribosomal peptide synthetase MxaA [Methylococcaceae bacterium]